MTPFTIPGWRACPKRFTRPVPVTPNDTSVAALDGPNHSPRSFRQSDPFATNGVKLFFLADSVARIWLRPSRSVYEKGNSRFFLAMEFVKERLAEAIDKAWKSRKRGGVSWGFGHAVVAYNRRISYMDGSARMYGPTNTANFSHVEGFEDHGVHVLFAHDKQRPTVPIGVAIDVACPAQEVGSGKNVNAD